MREQIKIKVDELTFDCHVSGNEAGQLVILLHGFPESSYMWVRLMDEISVKGFYCVAPDQRGYSAGASPKGKKNYALETLGNDIVSIAKALGREQFHLIGHDWGAAVGWEVVAKNPDLILSWSGLSVPHVQGFGEAIIKDGKQRKMSLYMLFFQIPFLPEFFLQALNFKMLRLLWKKSSKEEVDYNLSIYRNRRRLTTALNYYRGNFSVLKSAAKTEVMGDITAPTLFIWGQYDFAIGKTAVENGHKYCKGYYNFVIVKGSHWLIQTRYEEVRDPIIEHLIKFKQ